jgi:hypothetical protein
VNVVGEVKRVEYMKNEKESEFKSGKFKKREGRGHAGRGENEQVGDQKLNVEETPATFWAVMGGTLSSSLSVS